MALRHKRGWVGVKERGGPKTIVCAMTVAERFFEFATANGASSLLNLDQQHVDLFLGAYPGYRAGFGALLSRLERLSKVFGRLSAPPVDRLFKNSLLLGPDQQRTLLDRCFAAGDRLLSTAVPVSLLTTFPVRATTLLRTRRRDLTALDDGTYTIKFHKVPVPLTGDLAKLMTRFLTAYRGKETFQDPTGNEFLFPGAVAGNHLTAAALRYLMGDITLNQLFSSAIYGMYKSGLRDPGVLTDAFGIKAMTTTKYLALVEPQLQRHSARMLPIRERWVQAEIDGRTLP